MLVSVVTCLCCSSSLLASSFSFRYCSSNSCSLNTETTVRGFQQTQAQTSFFCLPLFHFLPNVNALLFLQLSLGKGPVHGLRRTIGMLAFVSLSSGLKRMVEPEHVVFAQYDAVTFIRLKLDQNFNIITGIKS